MRRIVGLALLLIICGAVAPVLRVSAQDIQNAGDAIDTRMRSGAHVDPASLAMQIHIPLGHYAGRAGNDLPITLDYSSKLWRTQFQASQIIGGPGGDVDSTYVAKYADSSAAGWTSSLDWFMWPYSYNGGLRYGDGMENPPVLYTGSNGLGQPCTASCTNEVTRMYAVLLDGSRHELRRDDTVYLTSSNPDVTSGTFYAVDSSRLIYNTANSTLYLPDGSRYVLNAASSTPVEYIDRNGNNLTYSSSGTWTDTLGRTYGRPLGLSQSVGDVTYNVPGVGSSSLTYTLRWRNMSDVLTTSGQLYYTGDRTQAYPHASLSPSLFTSPDDNDSVVGGDLPPKSAHFQI